MDQSDINTSPVRKLLQTQRVILRAAEPDDVDFLFTLENDPEVWRAGNTIVPFSRFQIEQYVLSTEHDIYAERQLRLLIEKKDEVGSGCIGAVDLFEFDPGNRRAGAGILVVDGERDKGYAYEAVEAIKRYAGEILNLHQLYCSVQEENVASIRLFEKAGFICTGKKTDWRLQNNRWTNELFYQFVF